MKTSQTSTADEGVERATVAAPVDQDRRLWITGDNGPGRHRPCGERRAVGGITVAQRERALGPPVEIELQTVQPGEVTIVGWRGKHVFMLRRSQDTLDALVRHDDLLADPASRRSLPPEPTRNALRSVAPGMVVRSPSAAISDASPAFVRRRVRRTSARHGRRLLLPVPRIQVRLRQPLLLERAGADDPHRPAS